MKYHFFGFISIELILVMLHTFYINTISFATFRLWNAQVDLLTVNRRVLNFTTIPTLISYRILTFAYATCFISNQGMSHN